MNPRFQTLILVYVLAAFLLYFMKPAFLFDADGNMKCFGTRMRHDACIYSYSLIVILGACIMFYVYHLMELRRHNIL